MHLFMVDEQKVFLHSVEMAKHANGAALYLEALLGGRFFTREQTREMIDFIFAGTKRNIESCPKATRQEIDSKMLSKVFLINILKQQMGL